MLFVQLGPKNLITSQFTMTRRTADKARRLLARDFYVIYKEINMGNYYHKGYKDGYCEAIKKLIGRDLQKSNLNKLLEEMIKSIEKDSKARVSLYAVTNGCCGRVDAHDIGCTR